MGLAFGFKSASKWPKMISRPKTANVSRRPKRKNSEKSKKILRAISVSLKKNCLLLFHQDSHTMDEDILRVHEPVHFSETIAHMEFHAHRPYASSTFGNSDEIRIAVQNQDLYVLPSHSSLHITGRLTKADGTSAFANTELVNNGICFLFEELRYELNGVEIDHCKNVGLTSVMKGYASLTLVRNIRWKMRDGSMLIIRVSKRMPTAFLTSTSPQIIVGLLGRL